MTKSQWCFCLGLAVLLGCGGEDYGKPVDVSGKITLNNEPLEGATVIFHSVEEGLPASFRTRRSQTNAEGQYTISEVYPAKYEVRVQKFSEGEVNPDEASAAGPMKSDPLAKYGENSPLSAEVSAEKTTFNFELPTQ